MPDQRVCYTIHNFRHQGTSDEQVLWATGLGRPDYFLDADRLGMISLPRAEPVEGRHSLFEFRDYGIPELR